MKQTHSSEIQRRRRGRLRTFQRRGLILEFMCSRATLSHTHTHTFLCGITWHVHRRYGRSGDQGGGGLLLDGQRGHGIPHSHLAGGRT